ncbi:MAG: metallophosphoesterase [Phototrophicaceae bacterium]
MRAIIRNLLLTALPVGAFYLYASRIEPHWLDVKSIEIVLPRLDPAFDGYRIAQFSDIHMDSHMTPARLQTVVERVNAHQPDLTVITGDFITRRTHYVADDITAVLRQLHAADGVLAIPGNHDYYNYQIDNVRRMMRDSGITDLSNRVHSIKRGEAQLHICGVDDVVYRKARLDLVLADLPDDGAAILLAHEPDFADISAPTGRFDLQLSGHTHGGQMRLPLVGALISPTHGTRYSRGLLDIDGMWLYTNVGVGTVSFNLRFNCRPEITVFTLRAPVTHPE